MARPIQPKRGGAKPAHPSVELVIRDVQQTRIAMLRSTIEFARACMRHAEQASDARTAGRGLRHARERYELARRLLAENSLTPEITASVRDELAALHRDIDSADRLQRRRVDEPDFSG